MRRRNIALILIGLILASCTDKDIDIRIEQDECKRFKISTPFYQLIEDPCSDSTKIRARVNFDFNKSPDCLFRLINEPEFYQNNNGRLTALSFNSIVPREEITIGNDNANYEFEASFSNADAAILSHIILDFKTQNELEVSSNKLQIRINNPCAILDPSTYNVNQNQVNIPRNQSVFTIRLWDNAAEDGDIVSVYLNGQWIIENHTLLNAGTDFNFSTSLLRLGANDLVVFALNEGTSGPNTVSIAINGTEIPNFQPGLLTGEAVRINF